MPETFRRGAYGEITSPLPTNIRELFTEFVARQEDVGIETINQRKGWWSATNYDVYGYDEDAHAVVVQRRVTDCGKYGTSVSKIYLLVWPGLEQEHRTIYRYRLANNVSPRRLGDGASPKRVVQWALQKIADEIKGRRPVLTPNNAEIQIVGDLRRKEFTEDENQAALLAWDTMVGPVVKPFRRSRAADVAEVA